MSGEPPQGQGPGPGGRMAGPPRPRGLLPITLIFIGMIVVILVMVNDSSAEPRDWNRFLKDLAAGHVVKLTKHRAFLEAEIDTNAAADGKIEGGSKTAKVYRINYPYGIPPMHGENKEMFDALDAGNRARLDKMLNPVGVIGSPPEGIWSGFFQQIAIFVLIIALLWFFVFRRMGQGGGVLSFGKSRATLIQKGKTTKTFKDVAGIDEAKEEVEELVAFLRHPRKFQKLGGRIPRGVLLVGPPGTGKTLLARAIAGEADVPFYSISGSDFVEMFVGVGASRVRDLFQQAKDNAPCIIFIDEIDAVARRRGSGISSGGHDEREQTLNAILVEMDGFASNDKVIVIAATNRVDVLDPALLRPGRFDRHINVDLPDINGREEILAVHAGKVKLGSEVDLSLVARGTPGFSGADLENLINEAALHAARVEKDFIDQDDLEYARDRVAFGREKKTGSKAMPEEERRITAYHEAGHALIQLLLDECDDLHKVTIIPRGGFLGASFSLPTDKRSVGRKKLLGDICIAFGGRVAEEKWFDDVTAGAKQDIAVATRYARAMVLELGMSDRMGPVRYTIDQVGLAGTETVISAAEGTRNALDEEVRRIIDEQYERSRAIIAEHAGALERIAEALLEYETLSADQVRILVDGGQLEPRKSTVAVAKPKTGSKKPADDAKPGFSGAEPAPA